MKNPIESEEHYIRDAQYIITTSAISRYHIFYFLFYLNKFT